MVGVGVDAIPGVPHFDVNPDLVLTVTLAPLLYAAARQVPFVDFRRNLRVIGFLRSLGGKVSGNPSLRCPVRGLLAGPRSLLLVDDAQIASSRTTSSRRDRAAQSRALRNSSRNRGRRLCCSRSSATTSAKSSTPAAAIARRSCFSLLAADR